MMENIFRNSAWLYDVDNRDNMYADIPFYTDYTVKQNGEILELGCGTGRVALALAKQGFRVTGNVFNPHAVMDESWCYPETVQWERLDENTGNYVVKTHWGDKIDPKNQIIYPHFAFEVTDKNGITTRITDDLKLKYYYRDQIESVIEKASF
jgi:SAM-dependent methyltransferase